MAKYPFENETVFLGKSFRIGQDWEVPIPAFFILSSKRKLKSILEFTDEESEEFMLLLKLLRKGMLHELKIKDVCLFQNEDTDHGFHVWVFPRHAWMEKFGRKIQSVRPIMEYAKEKMMTPKTIEEIKENVLLMKNYFEKNEGKLND